MSKITPTMIRDKMGSGNVCTVRCPDGTKAVIERCPPRQNVPEEYFFIDWDASDVEYCVVSIEALANALNRCML